MSVGFSQKVSKLVVARGASPAWRYNRAKLEAREEIAGKRDYTPSRDTAIIALKRLIKADLCQTVSPAIRRVAAPKAYRLLDLYMDDTASCPKHFIEAALMGKATYDYILQHIDVDLTRDDLEIYKSWFFDIEGRLDKQFWVVENILKPCAALTEDRRASGLMWKMYAYAGDLNMFEELASGAKSLSKATMEWARKRSSEQVVRELLKMVHDSAKLTRSTQYSLQQAQQIRWIEAESAVEKAVPEMRALAENCAVEVRRVLDAYAPNEELPARETIPDSILNLKQEGSGK